MKDLQIFLSNKFKCWTPSQPTVVSKSKSSVILAITISNKFEFIANKLIFRIEQKEKLPPWSIVYCGRQHEKEIRNLTPGFPHIFRLKIILDTNSVAHLANKAVEHYGSVENVYSAFQENHDSLNKDVEDKNEIYEADSISVAEEDSKLNSSLTTTQIIESLSESTTTNRKKDVDEVCSNHKISFFGSEDAPPWLESNYCEELWVSTLSGGASVICFNMAVKCGYIKQVQQMLDERPELVNIMNTVDGLTPLITAVKKGDVSMTQLLLSRGAGLEQRSAAGQPALALAVYQRHVEVARLLVKCGAELTSRDANGLRIEHYAVDSGDVEMIRFVLHLGGDVNAVDGNLWTPLFRAVCQNAKLEIISELVARGATVAGTDRAGLSLCRLARLLTDRRGLPREEVLRLLDPTWPRERAFSNFTRITSKITRMQSVFK